MKSLYQPAIAAGHPHTAKAGQQILNRGGNAFDAIIAAGFASAFTEPGFTSLGGGGFLLAHHHDVAPKIYDFFVDTPGLGLPQDALNPQMEEVVVHFSGAVQPFHIGAGSMATPGVLPGFFHVHRQLGKLSMEEVVAPAIELARQGITINASQSYLFSILQAMLLFEEEGRQIYAPEGKLLQEGDTLKNLSYANFLEQLANNPQQTTFTPAQCQSLLEKSQPVGGLLTLDDLNQYRVIEREPVTVHYRDRDILTNPPPSLGGGLIAVSLALLEKSHAIPKEFGSREHIQYLGQVMKITDELRADGYRTPKEVPESVWPQKIQRVQTRGTTHISVCDNEGNCASMTTSNGEGSGIFIPGTGIMVNNMMGEDDLHDDGFHSSPPGERVSSMMSPSMVMKGNEVDLVLGSGGSKRIRTAILQSIINVVDLGMSPQEAVNAPRLHVEDQILHIEPGFDKSLFDNCPLTQNHWPQRDLYFGGVHAVSPYGGGGGDSRRNGCVLLAEG